MPFSYYSVVCISGMSMSTKKKAGRRTRKSKKNYTVGQINKIIDSFVHPFYEKSQWFRLVDGAFHAFVEGDLSVSTQKFVRYNLREIVKEILEKR
jgi:hypothetical protein